MKEFWEESPKVFPEGIPEENPGKIMEESLMQFRE